MASAIIINGVTYYLADWMPLYLKTSRGFSFVQGNMLSIAIYAGSSAGNILTGLFVRWLVHLGSSLRAAKKFALVLSCVLMLTTVLAGFTPYRYLAFACLILTSIGSAGFSVIYTALGQDVCPAYVGVVAGFLGGAGNLAYGYLSPYIGMLADLHKNWLTLTLIGVLPWVALAPILLGFKEFDHGQ
jgi:MFS family permease